jgi:hypothetical protein
MPSNTYTLIEKITVGAAGASSITFTSIPQTYTDLKVVISVRDATNNNGVVKITFNGSATGYTARELVGSGAAASSDTNYTGSGTYYGTEGSSAPSNATASTFSNCEFYIPNYTSSNNKSISADSLYENNGTTAYQSLSAGLWSNSAAITSITVTQFSGNNFAQYSTFYLYGIAKEGVSPSPSSAPYATGGDSIVFDGTYWYHAFTSSGTFTPRKNINCDVLVVAGGGGASNGNGEGSGGGGAGGVCYQTGRSAVNATAYTVTVGGGGTGTVYSSNPTKGSNSVFDTITANGGGASKSEAFTVSTDRNGGSGGGGGGNGGGSVAGTATQSNSGGATGYGNNGGSGYASNPYTGGGGGGAGAVGANASSTAAGNGGAGLNTWSTWLSATSLGVSGYIAGGGAGGNLNGSGAAATGGSGGGGNGGKSTGGTVNNQPTAGTTNTGGGAGGGQGSSEFKNGGSGLVIVRYAA